MSIDPSNIGYNTGLLYEDLEPAYTLLLILEEKSLSCILANSSSYYMNGCI